MTSEQQAVPVAQEDREAAADVVASYRDQKNGNWQQRIRDGLCDDGEMVQAFARHRLASVSSASAEQVLAAFNGGMVQVPDASNPRGYVTYYRPLDAMRAALAASPKPVPATNQAGEVRVASALREIMMYVNRGHIEGDCSFCVQALEEGEQALAEYQLAALATQPATSQEGEA